MIIEEIYLKNNHFSGVFTDEIKEIQVLKEKLKVLKTAFIKEKKNRQEFEEKLRKLTESNTILIEENHRKVLFFNGLSMNLQFFGRKKCV